MKTKEIIIATGNANKVREISEIFKNTSFIFSSLKDHWQPVPDIPETGNSFEENATMKADWVYSRKNVWTLADDSGLIVDALDGRPGIYSARYAGEDASDENNRKKLLEELKEIPANKRTARFWCSIVLIGNNIRIVANGKCEGHIGFKPKGNMGFGYDPIFIPNGYSETFAELSSEEKHSISHRGKALQKMKERLNEIL